MEASSSYIAAQVPATPQPLELVGRAREMDLLRALWGRTCEGRGELALLRSDPGLGKTHLLSSFLREVQPQGVVLRHSCAPEERWSTLGLHRALEGLPRYPALLGHLAQVQGQPLRQLAEGFPALGCALGLEVPEDSRQAQPGPLAVQAINSVLGALERWRQPVLLVVDQAQWLDARSLRLLRQWAERANPGRLLVLLAYQTWEGGRALEDLSSQWGRTVLTLGRLSVEALTRVAARLLEEPAPHSTARALAQRSHGSPMLLMELLHGSLEAELLRKTLGGWRLVVHPDGLQEALWRRWLQDLPENQRRLLVCGATLGTSFSLEHAAALAPMPLRAARRCLEGSLWRRLVFHQSVDQFSFMHTSRREALLAGLEPPRRRALHACAAKLLETRQGDALEIAEHLLHAQQLKRAQRRAFQGAREAHRAMRFQAAHRGYQVALRAMSSMGALPSFSLLARATEVSLKCADMDRARALLLQLGSVARSLPQRATLLQLKGELASRHGDSGTALEAFRGALALRGLRPPEGLLATLPALALLFVQMIHQRLRAAARLGRGAPLQGEAARQERALFQLLAHYGHALWARHDRAMLLWVLLQQIRLTQRLPRQREVGLLWLNLGIFRTQQAQHSAAVGYMRRSLELLRRLHDTHGEGLAHSRLCFALYSAGRLGEAIESGRRAANLLEKAGDPREAITALHFTGLALVQQGRLEEALHCARRFQNRPGMSLDLSSWARALDLWSCATEGDLPERWLRGALERYKPWPRLRLRVAHAEALRRLRAEDAEGAARLLDEVLGGQRLLRSSLMAACITLRARAVRLSRSQQRPAVDWRCAVQQALHWGRRHPAYLCQALREEAWWCSAQGNLDRARQRLEEALEAARQRQQRHQEALTLEAWGQIGLLAGWEEGPRLLHQGQAMLERQRAPLRRHPLQLQPPAWARAQP